MKRIKISLLKEGLKKKEVNSSKVNKRTGINCEDNFIISGVFWCTVFV